VLTRAFLSDGVGDAVGDAGKWVTRSAAGRRRTPGELAAARAGDFPVVVSRRRGLAMRHARGVWETARTGVVNRAGGLWALVDGEQREFLGQVDLAFLATVAGHVRRCEECPLVWVDGEVPLDLLTAAVRRTAAWEVFRPVLREIRVAQGRSGRSRGST
jgi:hypothetical protein